MCEILIMDEDIYKRNFNLTKAVKLMCDILDELKDKSPNDILRITKQKNNIPVNLDDILNILGINKIPSTFEDLESTETINKKGEISGLVMVNGNHVGIFYKMTDSLHRKRFTIAHELGHCCLHADMLQSGYIEFRSAFSSTDEREIAANSFAGELLIPEKQLIEVYNQLVVPSLVGLSDIFEVSTNVMRERLKYLKYSFFDDSAKIEEES